MGCCGLACCVKPAFITMTTLIVIFGLIFSAAGIVLLIMGDEVGNLVNEMRDDVRKYVEDVMPEEVRKHVYKADEFLKIDFDSFVSSVTLALICFGSFFLVISVSGCIFARVMKWSFLVIYLVVWLVIGTIYVVIVLLIPGFVEDKLREELQTYAGFTDFSISGVTWTGIMVFFKCCGMVNYRDFHKLDNWPNTDLNKINLLAFHEGNQTEMFQERIDELNHGNGPPLSAAELDDISEKIRLGLNLTANEQKIKEQLDELPVQINFANLTINMNVSKFVTPLACCKWDPDNPDFQGKLTGGCNLEGLVNTSVNNMEEACPEAIVFYLTTGNGYVDAVMILYGLAFAGFAFLVVYCLLIALLIWIAVKLGGRNPLSTKFSDSDISLPTFIPSRMTLSRTHTLKSTCVDQPDHHADHITNTTQSPLAQSPILESREDVTKSKSKMSNPTSYTRQTPDTRESTVDLESQHSSRDQ